MQGQTFASERRHMKKARRSVDETTSVHHAYQVIFKQFLAFLSLFGLCGTLAPLALIFPGDTRGAIPPDQRQMNKNRRSVDETLTSLYAIHASCSPGTLLRM